MSRALPALIVCLASCGGVSPDLHGREPYARYLAVRDLADSPDAPSMAQLVAALDDPDSLVVTGALESLAEIGRPEFLQHAVPRLGHAHPRVRRQACATIAAIRNPDGVPFLAKAVKDPEPSVRRGAIHALVAFGTKPGIVEALLGAVGEADASTVLAAHEALLKLTGKTAAARTREAWDAVLK